MISGMAGIKRLLTYVLICVAVSCWLPPLHAHDVIPAKVHFRREYMIYQPTEDVLAVVRDYEHYDNLFPDIDKVTMQTSNRLHTIVRYDVRLLKRTFGGLLEFTEANWSNVTVIKVRPIRLYRLSKLNGILKVSNLGPKKTKIVVNMNVKPQVDLPGFFIDRMVEKTFDVAMRRLKHLAWQKRAVPSNRGQ